MANPNVIRHVDLECRINGSDKEYHIQILLHDDGNYSVNTQWGPRGNPYQGKNNGVYTSFQHAEEKFAEIYNIRLSHLYTPTGWGSVGNPAWHPEGTLSQAAGTTGHAPAAPRPTQATGSTVIASKRRRINWDGDPEMTLVSAPQGAAQVQSPLVLVPGSGQKIQTANLPQLPNEIDEDEVEKLLDDDEWGLQEKMDGNHEMVDTRLCDFSISLGDNTGLVLTNKKGIIKSPAPEFLHMLNNVMSGKPRMLVDGEHIEALYHVYDIHDCEKCPIALSGQPYAVRHMWLERYFRANDGTNIRIVPLYTGREKKREMFNYFRDNGFEGVIFKKLSAPLTRGKTHKDMKKFKFYAEASCRVANRETGKSSVGLELLDKSQPNLPLGVWTDVGNCTIPPNKAMPKPGDIVEIRYLYARKGGCLFQPTYKEPRDDIDEGECLMSQLKYKRGD